MTKNGLYLIPDLGLIWRAEVCLNCSLSFVFRADTSNQTTQNVIKAPQHINGSQNRPCILILAEFVAQIQTETIGWVKFFLKLARKYQGWTISLSGDRSRYRKQGYPWNQATKAGQGQAGLITGRKTPLQSLALRRGRLGTESVKGWRLNTGAD